MRKPLLLCLSFGILLAVAVPALGANTDLQPVAISVVNSAGCTGPPIPHGTVCVKVRVRNNGPDTYNGINTLQSAAAVNALKVTVDIDEPTKPGLDRPADSGSVTGEFQVTILSGAEVEVNLGTVPGYNAPAHGASNVHAETFAQGTNVDPNASNNVLNAVFSVTPALGEWGLIALVLVLVLCGVAGIRWRFRAQAAR